MEHSLFLLLIFSRLKFKQTLSEAINSTKQTKNIPFPARSGNKPLVLFTQDFFYLGLLVKLNLKFVKFYLIKLFLQKFISFLFLKLFEQLQILKTCCFCTLYKYWPGCGFLTFQRPSMYNF